MLHDFKNDRLRKSLSHLFLLTQVGHLVLVQYIYHWLLIINFPHFSLLFKDFHLFFNSREWCILSKSWLSAELSFRLLDCKIFLLLCAQKILIYWWQSIFVDWREGFVAEHNMRELRVLIKPVFFRADVLTFFNMLGL